MFAQGSHSWSSFGVFADYVKPRECSLGSLRVSAKGRLLANATGDKPANSTMIRDRVKKALCKINNQLQYVRKSEARK